MYVRALGVLLVLLSDSLPSVSLIDFKEPLSQYPVAQLYSACTTFTRYPSGASAVITGPGTPPDYALQLIPFDTALAEKDGTWQAHGKFVGVIENGGAKFEPTYNVPPAVGPQPGVTCVWFGQDVTTKQLMMRFVSSTSITSLPAVRETHPDSVHTAPKADWLPRGGPMTLLEEIPWYVCDLTGCCKIQ